MMVVDHREEFEGMGKLTLLISCSRFEQENEEQYW
jgi:hypothetical protein